MKLYLTSYKIGDESSRLLGMVPSGGRVAVVSNALDLIPMEAQLEYASRGGFIVQDWFRAQGLEVFDLDLRTYFRREDIGRALDRADLIWVVGGNSFLLLRAVRQSGLEPALKQRLALGSIVYGGWSAGACVAGATLKGIHLMDRPYVVAEGYDAEPQWDGMGLVDYVIVPHFESDHPEAQAASSAVDYLQAQGIRYRTLRDGESIIIGDKDGA